MRMVLTITASSKYTLYMQPCSTLVSLLCRWLCTPSAVHHLCLCLPLLLLLLLLLLQVPVSRQLHA
jgi:hypothetical protein